ILSTSSATNCSPTLAVLDAGRKPVGLDLVNVIEIQAADGERLQVFNGGGFVQFFAEWDDVRRENPRSVRGDASDVLLNSVDAVEMAASGRGVQAGMRARRRSCWKRGLERMGSRRGSTKAKASIECDSNDFSRMEMARSDSPRATYTVATPWLFWSRI